MLSRHSLILASETAIASSQVFTSSSASSRCFSTYHFPICSYAVSILRSSSEIFKFNFAVSARSFVFLMVVWLTSLIFCPKLLKKDIYFTPFLYQKPYVMNYHNMLSEKHKEVYRLFMSFSVFLPGHAWCFNGWFCSRSIFASWSFHSSRFFRCRSFHSSRFR